MPKLKSIKRKQQLASMKKCSHLVIGLWFPCDHQHESVAEIVSLVVYRDQNLLRELSGIEKRKKSRSYVED